MRSFTGQLGTALSGPGNVVPGLVPSAAIKAKQCFFPVSSWVHAFILTCDDKLAVWFKRRVRHVHHVAVGGVPGVCCLYPQSNRQLYDLAVAWWSAGHFVHRFLYRLMPYVLVAPPKAPCGGDCPSGGVVVGCCANALPATLHATFTGALSSLGSVAITWNGVSSWVGQVVACGIGSPGITVTFRCSDPSGPTWALNLSGLFFAGTGAGSCSPLAITGNGNASGIVCSGAFTWTVTT